MQTSAESPNHSSIPAQVDGANVPSSSKSVGIVPTSGTKYVPMLLGSRVYTELIFRTPASKAADQDQSFSLSTSSFNIPVTVTVAAVGSGTHSSTSFSVSESATESVRVVTYNPTSSSQALSGSHSR